ncbi:Lyzozyme M1 (1,4-beta-N-acetylmuramidase) [Bifidobacterium ramosum]|uniref:Lyzozyme M1 (1,4-beta-N-acetylmuramidase) n=1 Tax=Bifidobacterium ramosum TaxID=1798158 RepID=A0A6L4X3I4_9BIFI|nr:GH25 family lysozyme [Bifidobacterium ramosum]KAB8289292.1 Lyzozyme M1 (1,4-beta-N-acetylmuramidase) [Bifidobacterium ramosum]NEG70997.1 hypothetical protein [Bifidobacterium ramosum]
MALQGIDISNWQAGLDTAAVPSDFVIAKASEGVGFADPTMQGFLARAAAAGRLVGTYHYATGADPVMEADHYLAVAGDWISRAILVLDWESGSNKAWGDGGWVRRFVTRVHDRTGVWPLVYVQASAIGQIPGDVRAHCPLWIAQYASMQQTGYQDSPWNEGAYSCVMRQYSGTGRLSGWNGDLDLDKFYGDRDEWTRLAKGDNDMVTKQDIQQIAEAVVNIDLNGVKLRDRIIGIDTAANTTRTTTREIKTSVERNDKRVYRLLQSLKRFTGIPDDDTTSVPDLTQSWLDKRVYRITLLLKRLTGIPDDATDLPDTVTLSDTQLDLIADRVAEKLNAMKEQ